MRAASVPCIADAHIDTKHSVAVWERAMCIQPREFNGVMIACRQCWQCKANRVDSIVGRCIAEQKTSVATYCVTLTYGGDDRITRKVPLQARILDYEDVSKYLKRLRKTVPVRYVAAGEYGDTKGRGHWHLILFLPRLMPGVKLYERFIEKHWRVGYSYWEPAIYEKMRYACSYVLKNADNSKSAERRYGSSRFPPLGREYFKQVAFKHVEQQLSPQDCYYFFPEIRDKGGKIKPFLLTRKSAEYFKQDFVNAWAMAYGNLNWPQSDMIDEYLDQICRERAIRPGDWLEERRWMMQRLEKREQWRGGEAVVGVGIQATRLERARDKLDERLMAMGNRKGIGYVPTSTHELTNSLGTLPASPSRLHPLVEQSFGKFGARSLTTGGQALHSKAETNKCAPDKGVTGNDPAQPVSSAERTYRQTG